MIDAGQLARRTGNRSRGQAGHMDPQLRPATSRDPHDLAADPRARRRADHQGDARYRLPALGVREARRASQLQPVRDGSRPQELHQPADERSGLASRRREAAGYRADPAVPVHPGDHLASWRGSATTCSARVPRRSTWGPSPPSSTPSTCASRSTTSTRKCRATGSIRDTPGSAACSTTSMIACSTGSPSVQASFPRASMPTWRSCSSATGSSWTGCGAWAS